MVQCSVLFEIIFVKTTEKNIKGGLKKNYERFSKSCDFSSVLNNGNKPKNKQ